MGWVSVMEFVQLEHVGKSITKDWTQPVRGNKHNGLNGTWTQLWSFSAISVFVKAI